MYELIDSGEGRRLEKFGDYILDRPDPQIIWKKTFPDKWSQAHAFFQRTTEDKGEWVKKLEIPDTWEVSWQNLKLQARLTPFKHTGIFPDQQWQWQWLSHHSKGLKVLNLFGYTGIASLVCAEAGAKVTYVDASRPALTWARINQELSRLSDRPIRWIHDDVMKFVAREAKRNTRYDAIIMDPPTFGHGPGGETWQFNKSLPLLLDQCKQILSDSPTFVLINAYAVTTSSITLGNVLADLMGKSGKIETGDLLLKSDSTKCVSTGIWGQWTNG